MCNIEVYLRAHRCDLILIACRVECRVWINEKHTVEKKRIDIVKIEQYHS